MALGKRDGIRPADVVGSIANEAGISGSEIGPIEIRDEITYVSIPARYRDDVVAKLGGARFRGRPVNLRVAANEAPSRERPRDDRERASTRDTRSSAPPAGRYQRDTRNERPRTGKPFRPGAAAAPRSDRADRPRTGKPFAKPFAPKGKPFVSKAKPKPRKG